jgi:GTPase SAR1 family protein
MKTLINYSHVFGDSAVGEAKAGVELGSSPDLSGWAEAAQFIEEYSDTLDAAGAGLVKTLWEHEKIQNTYAARSKFQLTDSSAYYFNKVEEVAAPGYLPSDADILRSRVRTSGIVEEKYNIEGVTFSMYDVGGQRNERKKWIHCFENVTAVIFVASLSAYDQVLYEDENTNRMQEAINLFGQICNEDWFRETSIILFMNKKDLFEEKIKRVNPKDVTAPNGSKPWDDFTGELGDELAGSDYFGEKFLSMNQAPETHAVTKHNTCATDTDNVRVVFETCKSVILEENLSNAGFM